MAKRYTKADQLAPAHDPPEHGSQVGAWEVAGRVLQGVTGPGAIVSLEYSLDVMYWVRYFARIQSLSGQNEIHQWEYRVAWVHDSGGLQFVTEQVHTQNTPGYAGAHTVLPAWITGPNRFTIDVGTTDKNYDSLIYCKGAMEGGISTSIPVFS